ncbi:MAG: protein kinase domain-containing protein [Thermoanaerobaculia bacterium]
MSEEAAGPEKAGRPRGGISSPGITSSTLPAGTPVRSEKPKFSLTVKIFLAVALLVFLALGAAVEISSYRVRSIAVESSRKALSRAKDSYDNFQEDRYEKLHRALRPVVDNSGFKALVHEGDAATIFNSLKEDQASATGADFLIVTDPRGVSIVRSDKREWRHDISNSALVRKALDGAETEGIWYSDGKLYHAVAAPVVSGEGRDAQTLGVLVACFAIDDRVAENFRDVSSTDALFLSNLSPPTQEPRAEVVASTLGSATKPFFRTIESRKDLVSAVLQQGKIAGPLSIDTGEDTYLALAWPLRLASGLVVGAVVTVRPLSRELAAFREIEKTLLIVGLGALLAAFLVSYWLARRMTGPIGKMVEATDAVRDGNYDVPLPVHQKDEIGILARSFRMMIEELKEKAELEKQLASLTMGGVGPQKTVAMPAVPPISAAGGVAPRIGTLFAGRYDIESELGVGGMGIVYKAHDRTLDDAVAIKVLRNEALAQDASLIDRFKQEIRLARRITHRNVLRTHDFGESNGLRYLSMEYVRGITLKHLLDQNRRLPVAAALRIARQICGGLGAAHSAGVIHRDIKPQNILIEPNGGLKIMDFGIARLSQDKGMTATGMVVGTPDYISPEQAKGGTLDPRTDIYSAGIVFYELFSGALPFEGDSALGVVLKHIQDKPPAIETKYPEIDPRIAKIVMKAIEKDPDRRYQSIAEMNQELSEVTA